MILTSIDPGTHHAGVAVWSDGKLARAYLAHAPPKSPWLSFIIEIPPSTDHGIIEVPQVYPGSPVKHEDLIQLAAAAGAIAGYCRGTWTQARPGIWTRQTCQEKSIRLERAWDRLSVSEREAVELPSTKLRKADVLDAVALGLWYLKRW